MYILLILHVFILFHLSHLNEIKFYKKMSFINIYYVTRILHFLHIEAMVTIYGVVAGHIF